MQKVESGGHVPVMAPLVRELLLGNGGSRYFDCTVGGGGHAKALLSAADRPLELYGIDRDPSAIEVAAERLKGLPGVHLRTGNFADLADHARLWDLDRVDGIFADLGQSSLQLDDPERGFSFMSDGPLDLRYDRLTGTTAAEVVNTLPQGELARIIRIYGEERRAGHVAAGIVRNRPLERTSQLARIVRECCPGRYTEKSLARVFLSLRNYVNGDLDHLKRFLDAALGLLRSGGRLVVISYDSLQDRIVKSFFRLRAQSCTCPPDAAICVCSGRPELVIMTKKPVRPDREEVAANRRSRSALLRCAEKV